MGLLAECSHFSRICLKHMRKNWAVLTGLFLCCLVSLLICDGLRFPKCTTWRGYFWLFTVSKLLIRIIPFLIHLQSRELCVLYYLMACISFKKSFQPCTGLSSSWVCNHIVPAWKGHAGVTDRSDPGPDQLSFIVSICLSVRPCRPRLDEMQADGRRCELQPTEKWTVFTQ